MPTEPWAAYPPEMNAARILGTGPAALFVAAGSWTVMSAQTAAGQGVFMAQNANQAANIHGAVSDTVNATAPPFGAWLNDFVAESARNAVEYAQFAQAHIAALSTMVPLPVIIANRVASAAGHAATAAGAVNPVGVAADAAYEGFRVQNAAVMTTYDAVATGSSTPRVYATPPPLVTGGSASGVTSGQDVVSAAQQAFSPDAQAAFDGAVSQARSAMGDPASMAGLQNTAAGGGAYASAPAAMSPMLMQQTAMAMSPAAMVAGQMASPQGPGQVTASGLGSGSQAMAPMRSVSGGGLPLASSGSTATSPSTSVGSAGSAGRSMPNLSSLASLLGGAGAGSPAAGSPAASGAGAGAGARAFSGIPSNLSSGTSSTGTGHGPMGAMPHSPGKQGDKRSSVIEIKETAVEDPVADQMARAKALARFR